MEKITNSKRVSYIKRKRNWISI